MTDLFPKPEEPATVPDVAPHRRVPGSRAGTRPRGRRSGSQRPGTSRSSRRPRTADCFSGIGGFAVAFERAGAEVVFACDNDPLARQTYEANFRPSAPERFDAGRFAGDIREVDMASVPDFDVLTAGFPCQPFSDAGRRRGFQDPRGTLFFELLRVLEAKRPAAYFFENVVGLQTHDRGRTLATIRHELTSALGYSFHSRVVRACDFGLPQLRPRLFMVGFQDPSVPFVWPEPIPLRFTLSDLLGGVTERQVSRTVLASGRGKPYGSRFAWDVYLVNGREHRLTVDEVRALQGFPANFVLPKVPAHAFRQLGNAVAIPAVEAVARELLSSLSASSSTFTVPMTDGINEKNTTEPVAVRVSSSRDKFGDR